MSDRLKFFRRLMSAFEGTSNPQRAVERGFYVNLPNSPIEVITRRIELSPSSVHLLFGGIGSGKTTQLLLIEKHLNKLEDIKAIYVDVSLLTDISNLKSGALIVIAGLELITILETIDNSQIEKSKQIIKKAAHGYSETKIVTSPLSSISAALTGGSVTTFHKGLLSSEKQENRELILKAFVELKKAVKAFINKEIIFLFDSLDRLSNSEIFVNSVLDDVVEINNSEVADGVTKGEKSMCRRDSEDLE